MSDQYIVALDQGTTSSRTVLFDKDLKIVRVVQREFPQYFPHEGWVEHDPMEIFASQYGTLNDCLLLSGISARQIKAIGITNQRETTIVWEKSTGKPICNAIVWQCRRTAPMCEKLKEDGWADYITKTTGLRIDAYFSATKVAWILDNIPGARERARNGELLFGTVDTWLMWKLSGGTIFATDYTNASRTMMFNIHTRDWDQKLLDLLDIPRCMLPEVKPSAGIFGEALVDGVSVPIAGVAGDQQAALFGQCCWQSGQVKNTYGTGCFMLMNTGDRPIASRNGLLTTIAASDGDSPRYALEGSVFTAGAVVQWLRDEVHLIEKSSQTEELALKVPDSGGVYLVPAFTGLGAPNWDMYARGMMIGITRGTTREHIVRAALESIAYSSNDLLEALEADTGMRITELVVDGGAAMNNFLMQFQADLTGLPVMRPAVFEATAMGAASLAGLATGFWAREEIKRARRISKVYTSQMDTAKAAALNKGWHRAVNRALSWAKEEE